MSEEVVRRRPALQGFLQAFQPLRLRGWAWLPASPDEHVRIEVRVDGQPLLQTTAAAKFPDLEKHNIGKGDHGFLIHLKAPIPVDQPERVEVIAMAADGTQRALQMSAGARARAGLDAPPPAVAPVQVAKVAAGARAEPAAGLTPVDDTQHPVFVLGSARSGTTAMMQALRATGRYAGFNEGHLLQMFAKLDAVVGTHYARSVRDAAPGMNTLIANVSSQQVRDALQAGFVELMRGAFPTRYWLDKTPGPDMIKSAPLMRRIWPNARFVFMKRRPVDNIESRRRKFPTISFKDHCRLWAESMTSWHAIRDGLASVSLEIDQVKLALEPEDVTGQVQHLLGLTPAEAERMLTSLRTDRPQRTGKELASVVDLASVDWSEDERGTFRETCAEAMRLFGYEADLIEEAPRGRKERASRRKPASC